MIDTEKLRALLAAGSRRPWRQGTEERWHVFGDVGNRALMVPEFGRVVARMNEHFPYEADAALIAAAVNALPELLDALATAAQVSDRVQTIADEDFGPFPTEPADTCLTYIEQGIFGLRQALATAEQALAKSREKVGNQRAQLRRFNRDGQAVSDALIGSMYEKSRLLKERTRALATAEDERLTLARAIRGGNAHLSPTVNELAARIVAEADAAAAGKEQQR